jgi:hypothetical protein
MSKGAGDSTLTYQRNLPWVISYQGVGLKCFRSHMPDVRGLRERYLGKQFYGRALEKL